MTKRVFLVHGWDGRPDNHWFPWLSLELKANGFSAQGGPASGWEVNAPQMPHAPKPRVKEWLEFLKEYVGKADKDTYFVGHSLGCITTARYLEIRSSKTRIGGAVFVAGFSGRINVPEVREFYELPFNSEKARLHSDKFVMIFSDNDPYVPMEKSLEMARQLGAKTILERGKGHFTAGDGVTSLPSALSALLKMAV